MQLLNKYDISIIQFMDHKKLIKVMEKSLEYFKRKHRIVSRILNLFTV